MTMLVRSTVLLAFLSLLGCATGSSGHGSRGKYDDPVARSELRERAIELLGDTAVNDPAPELRANAVEALSMAPSRFEGVAPAALLDENLGVRAVTALAAGRIRQRSLMPAVEPLLNDDSPIVRASAIFAMRRFGAPTDPTPLATMLMSDPSPRARAHAAMLLGDLGDPSARTMLREAAGARLHRAPLGEVRLLQLQIAEALVKLGDDAQVQSIRAALYPATPDEYEAAALAVQILGEVRDFGAIGQLVHLAEYRTPDGEAMPPEIRLGVAIALAKMGHREGAFVAAQHDQDPNPPIRAQAALVYGYTDGPKILERLEALLGDPEPVVRVAAGGAVIRYLARHGTDPAPETPRNGG